MRKFLIPAAAALLALTVGAFAKNVPLITGPLDPSSMLSTLNTLVNSINTYLAPNGQGSMSPALTINNTASAVNGLSITPSATGNPVLLGLDGTNPDTNVDLIQIARGTGKMYLGGAGTAASASLQIVKTTSAVNQIRHTPGATGTAPVIDVSGPSADTNRNLNIAGAGTGIVTLGGTAGTGGLSCTGSGATPQTCNGQRGIVTTNSLTTAAATNAAYVINNSSVTTSSMVHCTNQGYSGTIVTNGYPVIMTCVPGSGTITVNITNTHAANALSGTVQIGFTVMN